MIENTLLRLRRADRVDEARFLAWRNDPWIVALGSLNRTITAEEHRAWFTQRIADIRHPIWVIEIAGEPSGMVRLDPSVNHTEAEISIYLMRVHCGKGNGARVLECVANNAANLGYRILHATVRRDNVPSQKAFLRAGYQIEPGSEYQMNLRLTLNAVTTTTLAFTT
jgi:RimJ/RimL family protein N-acetyltransferase